MSGVKINTDKLISNVIPQDAMRKVQLNVLEDLKNILYRCYGPAASNTLFLQSTGETGTASTKPISKYTKDGKNILKNTVYTGMLENAIAGQIESITEKVEHEVGDGTTSATILSYYIFKALLDIEEKTNLKPAELMRNFKKIVNEIKDNIRKLGKEATLEDIYNVALVSTNGNEEIASDIKDIYEKFGMQVWINVLLSNNSESMIKSYDGLTLEVGYSDAAYINSPNETCVIKNPRIYQFVDAIDTQEMVTFMQKIISENIVSHSRDGQYIPTVIIAPKISRDASAVIQPLIESLYKYNEAGIVNQKPPILIITNIGPYSAQYIDIARLCGCKQIVKYLDPKLQEADIEAGRAPSLDTVVDWYGTTDEITSDVYKTTFVNPLEMFVKDEKGFLITNEDGEFIKTETYKGLLKFLETQLKDAESTSDIEQVADLRRRLNCLNCALVDYYIGGTSIEDRNAIKDSVDDAVKNCRSAAKYGVGQAANCSGLTSANEVKNKYHQIYVHRDNIDDPQSIEYIISSNILNAYENLIKLLYKSVVSDSEADKYVLDSIKKGALDLNTLEFNGKIICSIRTDEAILEVVSEIVTFMFTSNQALLPVAHANHYVTD